MIFIDSFSGQAADLKPKQRTTDNLLAILSKYPRISTWDMSENKWLVELIGSLIKLELIIDNKDEPYPWHRYFLTEKGREYLAKD